MALSVVFFLIFEMILGTPAGRYLVIDHSDDSALGRWDSYWDADAHVGEHQAMDPEADLEICDLAEMPWLVD